ncbi:MAG: ABC transporter [Magnetococcales bacterium]|nr:ABC transporter [Magnetococcales bacterium]PPR18155.1 MAG: ABC transporter ATP-binding protein YtrE [Pseudomonadota bacterium]|tara:strand:- start:1954 stop:2640 length:687 start_codon:yes stop_codon:yes gene_type:complete
MRDVNNIIGIENLSLNLLGPNGKQVSILHNVNLNVQAGESVSIVGPSGSGKTSLMMLISGVEKATSGQIEIAGQDITHYNEDQLAAFRGENIGVVFQNFHLIPTMTAFENVSVSLELAGHTDTEQKALDSLKAVGLEKRMHHYPEQLSGGEQQRVAIARAFATHPKILLADEPTGNLDSETGKLIVELLFSLTVQYGTTLVLITHDEKLANKTSRKLVMKDGVLNSDA